MSATTYHPPAPSAQRTIYVDDELIVVDKPAGLLSVPGRGPEKAVCAQTYAAAMFGTALVVHRLDMDTSGLLVFARTKYSQSAVSKQFELRRVEKSYEAIVTGRLAQETGVIAQPIAKYSLKRPIRHTDPDGQEAITYWSRLSATHSTSRVSLSPKTGRSHQLRLHMSTIGHSILGDPLYGNPDSAPRLLLHARRLKLFHPSDGVAFCFRVDVPF